jgi:uncharacterized protein
MPRRENAVLSLTERTMHLRGRRTTLEHLEQAGGALYAGFSYPDHPRFAFIEQWLIPAQGWVVNRFTMHPHARPWGSDWYIDLDHVTVAGDTWLVHDRFLDLVVHEGRGYELLDADELAEGMASGEITAAEVQSVLHSLHTACAELRRLDFSVKALLEAHAPGLAR